jgi:hypothetical protein
MRPGMLWRFAFTGPGASSNRTTVRKLPAPGRVETERPCGSYWPRGELKPKSCQAYAATVVWAFFKIPTWPA